MTIPVNAQSGPDPFPALASGSIEFENENVMVAGAVRESLWSPPESGLPPRIG